MPLLNILQDAGLGVSGSTLFLNMLPSEATQGILLRNPLRGTDIDYELIDYYKTQFQLIVRTTGDKLIDGEMEIRAVLKALTINERQVEDHYFKYCRPHTEPVVFPISKGNLIEFNVMFDCCFVKHAN